MTEFGLFVLAGFIYVVVNLPFRNLACHQDAGWHSYWAAFRTQGVELRYQESMLLGCSRLGCAFLYVLWFRLFGFRNPDRLGRYVALAINIGVVVVFFVLAPDVIGLDRNSAWSFVFVFLMFMSLPTLGVHYETAERTVNLFDVLVLLAAIHAFQNASPEWVGLFSFVALLMAFSFKITQLAPYGLVWIVLFGGVPSFETAIYSSVGSLAALLVFLVVLWRNDLLHAENLGVLRYAAHQAAEKDCYNQGIVEQKISEKVANKKLVRFCCRISLFLGVERVVQLYETASRAKTYWPMVVGSLSGSILVALIGVLYGPTDWIAVPLAWLIGAIVALVVQGRFFPFHFIPILLPLAVLVSIGWGDVIQRTMQANQPFIALGILAALMMAFDIWRAFRGRPGEELDYRFWPSEMRPILEKNLVAEDAAQYVNERTSPDDYVLVLGTLPQFYLLAQRRCPINWLSTSAKLMDPILPDWKSKLLEKVKETPPHYVLDVDHDFSIEEIEFAAGKPYRRTAEFRNNAFLYCLPDGEEAEK